MLHWLLFKSMCAQQFVQRCACARVSMYWTAPSIWSSSRRAHFLLPPQSSWTWKYFCGWQIKSSEHISSYIQLSKVFLRTVGVCVSCRSLMLVWACVCVCGVAPLSPFHGVLQISSFKKKKKGKRKGGERRERRGGGESLLKGLLHCTTSAAGRAQTHPSCQRETNEDRLETIHKPHPLQWRQRLTGWKSGRPHRSTKCSLRL